MVQTIPELIASQACLRMNRMIEKEPLPCSIAIVSISIPPLTFFLNLGSPSEVILAALPIFELKSIAAIALRINIPCHLKINF